MWVYFVFTYLIPVTAVNNQHDSTHGAAVAVVQQQAQDSPPISENLRLLSKVTTESSLHLRTCSCVEAQSSWQPLRISLS